MRPAVLLALVMMVGCGDDDGDASNWVAIDQIPGAYKDAYCTYYARCGLFPDKDTCLKAQLNMSFNMDQNDVAAVIRGLAIYNGSKMKECIDAIANNTCDKTDESGRATLLACRELIRGTVEEGGPCTVDVECESLQCSGGSSGTTCSMGICFGQAPPPVEPAALGEACTQLAGCVSGAYCDSIQDICVALKANGATCQTNNECAYGFGCAGTTTRTCQALPAVGQPCPMGVCRDDGVYCSSTATPTCTAIGLPPALCSSSASCSPYYPCDFTLGQCKKAPSLGEMCSSRCFETGVFCDTNLAVPVCVAARGDGSMCNDDEECTSGNCDLNSATPICTRPQSCF